MPRYWLKTDGRRVALAGDSLHAALLEAKQALRRGPEGRAAFRCGLGVVRGRVGSIRIEVPVPRFSERCAGGADHVWSGRPGHYYRQCLRCDAVEGRGLDGWIPTLRRPRDWRPIPAGYRNRPGTPLHKEESDD